MRFSQRKGITKPRTEIQTDYIDEYLKNGLWNVLTVFYWRDGEAVSHTYPKIEMQNFLSVLWHSFFKWRVDSIPYDWRECLSEIEEFYFDGRTPWYVLYDFIEFVAQNYPSKELNERFMDSCNVVLERELSAYRFVGERITEVTAEEEISEIEEALESPFKTVSAHIDNALKLMSDKKAPDYRNSIKESISAVEAICRIIAGSKKATLGQALDIIERKGKIEFHGALKRAFDSLYGYTSSAEEGIRHSLLKDKANLEFEDAKFMLVSCSAFINYLKLKASKAKIKIE